VWGVGCGVWGVGCGGWGLDSESQTAGLADRSINFRGTNQELLGTKTSY
jgi:hypothetical protein